MSIAKEEESNLHKRTRDDESVGDVNGAALVAVKTDSNDENNNNEANAPNKKPRASEAEETSTTTPGVPEVNESDSDSDDEEEETPSKGEGEATTSAEGSATAATTTNDANQKITRKAFKYYVILVAYVGSKYSGLQIQPDVETIEGELLKALYAVGAVESDQLSALFHMKWMRTARTDKGVHAARNVVTARMFKRVANSPTIVQDVNAKLPEDIRVLAIKNVAHFFHAKNHCKRRRYEYIIPTFVFAPKFKKEGKELIVLPTPATPWKFNDEAREKVNSILAHYIGTHSFHNFTDEDVDPQDASVQRYIVDFKASEPFMMEGIEFTRLCVYGQSFMLHQIRKMIGLALCVSRGLADESIFETAFNREYRVNIPMVPSLGLFLDRPEFPTYDNMAGKYGPLNWDETVEQAAEQFKKDHIYRMIASIEKKKFVSADYMFRLERDRRKFLNPIKFSDLKKRKRSRESQQQQQQQEQNHNKKEVEDE